MTIALRERNASRSNLAAILALALPTLLVAVDISILSIALPTMVEALQPSAGQLLWVVDSYNFFVAGSMLTMAAVADRFGRRRVIVLSAVVFAVASGFGAFSPSVTWVILARSVMGVAGSAILPASLGIIATLYDDEASRARAMGAFMTVFLLGMAGAPLVGGVLLSQWWWGSVFLIGVPVMLVAAVVVPRVVPESPGDGTTPIDLVSAAQSLAAILLLVAALKSGTDHGITASAMAMLAAGLALGYLFVRRQTQLDNPLVDLDVLRRPAAAGPLAVLLLTALLMGGSSIFFTLYVQQVQGLTPLEAAGWFLPQMAAMIAASNVGPWLAARGSRRTVTVAMLLTMTAGFAGYALLEVSPAGLVVAAASASLATFGIGGAFPLLMETAISAGRQGREGSSAALAQLSNELGIALGIALLGCVGTLVYRARLGLPGSDAEVNLVEGLRIAGTDPGLASRVREAWTDSYNTVGLVGLAVMAVVLLVTISTTRTTKRPTEGTTR